MSDQDLVGKFRVTLNESERESLLGLIKKGKVAARKIVRARILLLSDEGEFGPGKCDVDIVSSLDCGVRTVERIRKKFVTLVLRKQAVDWRGCVSNVARYRQAISPRLRVHPARNLQSAYVLPAATRLATSF